MQKTIIDDSDALMAILPPFVSEALRDREDRSQLLEVVMDLGRPPEARFHTYEIVLSPKDIAQADLEYVATRIGVFNDDNRAGIERTLHRISAIRNRQGRIVGLTGVANAVCLFLLVRYGLKGILDLTKPWRFMAFGLEKSPI